MHVIGFPKSGNTWLCYLLAYCFNVELDNVEETGQGYPPHLEPYLTGGMAHQSYGEKFGPIIKSHRVYRFSRQKRHQPFVYLVRDGRDVMVSYYFYHYFYRTSQAADSSGTLGDHLEALKQQGHYWLAHSPLRPLHFSRFIHHWLPRWVDHVNYGLDQDYLALVRYEDLQENAPACLAQVMQDLDITVEPETIEQAIALFSFKNLARRQSGDEQPKAFFRKGKVGDWQQHFSAKDLAYFQAQAGEVMARLGYE